MTVEPLGAMQGNNGGGIMKPTDSSAPGMKPFVDHLNISGDKVDNPSWEQWALLEDRLRKGALMSFSLQRQSDRDADMDFEYSSGDFAIVGAEDSERGTFGFSYLDPAKSSRLVTINGQEYREYSTTRDVEIVIKIARSYFQTGDLDRSVTWHVSCQGLGRQLKDIPASEILRPDRLDLTLETIIAASCEA